MDLIEKKYYKSFDAIKGIVVFLCVTAGHYWQFSPGAYWLEETNYVLLTAGNGLQHFSFSTYSLMELLFMLSGFQLSMSYAGIVEGKTTFGDYMKKKIKRLFPITVFTTILMIAGIPLYQNITGEEWNKVQFNGQSIFLSLFNVSAWVGSDHPLNGPLWYVSVYLLCLVLYFVLAKAGKKTGLDWAIFVLPVLVGIFIYQKNYKELIFNNDTARGFVGFFMGVLVAFAFAKMRGKVNKIFGSIVSLCLIAAWIVIKAKHNIWLCNNGLINRVLLSILLLYIPLIYLLTEVKIVDKIIGNPVLATFGATSMWLYALNFPFYLWTENLNILFRWDIPYTKDYTYWIFVFAQIAFAFLFYYLQKGLIHLFKDNSKEKNKPELPQQIT